MDKEVVSSFFKSEVEAPNASMPVQPEISSQLPKPVALRLQKLNIFMAAISEQESPNFHYSSNSNIADKEPEHIHEFSFVAESPSITTPFKVGCIKESTLTQIEHFRNYDL